MNSGDELCPICRQPVNPGACETCVHYFGMVSDGEMIWSDRFETFSDAWAELAEACETFRQTHGRRPKPLVRDAYRAAIRCVQSLDPSSTGATAALIALLPFERGPTIETEGKLSCSGYSVYLRDPEVLGRVIAAVRVARSEIVAVCGNPSS